MSMNRICELLGCEVPVIEGGLAYVGNGALAAAVSEAGGFGQIGSGGRTPEDFERQIQIALARTSRPVGVNMPISEHKSADRYLAIIKQYATKLRAVSLSAGNPRPLIEPLHDMGLRVITLASTPMQAVKAEQAGADIVVCEGTEAGGHNGPNEVTTMTLVPAAVDAVSIPVVAAGGIADGRTAAAAFCLGATGVQVGTRFVATTECQANETYKEAILSATTEDTRVIERSLGRITRVLASPFVDRILEQEQRTPGDIEKLLPLVNGQINAKAALDGLLAEGYVNCGQSAGLVRNITSAGQVVQNLISEVRQVLESTSNHFGGVV